MINIISWGTDNNNRWGNQHMILNDVNCQKIWDATLDCIHNMITEKGVFEQFFVNNTKLVALNGNEAVISVNNKFTKSVFKTKYLSDIQRALHQVTETHYNCIIKGQNEGDDMNTKPLQFFTNLNSNYTFNNFVIGPSNTLGRDASLAVCADLGKLFNPLFLYGKSGIGKTHLLQAIGNYVHTNMPNQKILYLAAPEFINEFIKASHLKNFAEIDAKFDNIDVLLIDDVQFLENKTETAIYFLNIFNRLINNNKQIVLTSDREPSQLRGIDDRLLSRFDQGLKQKIDVPEYETAYAILKTKIADHNMDNIPDDVVAYLATSFAKDVRQLEGALNSLLFYTISHPNLKQISLDVATIALADLAKSNSTKSLSLEDIIRAVSYHYNVAYDTLISNSRKASVTNARHISIYLCRQILDAPFEKIGQELGNRDHSTIMSGWKKIDNLYNSDFNYKNSIDDLRNKIENFR
jgi:chromosomal replication initiator protein